MYSSKGTGGVLDFVRSTVERGLRTNRGLCFSLVGEEPSLSHHASLLPGEESEAGRLLRRRAGEFLRAESERGAQLALPPP